MLSSIIVFGLAFATLGLLLGCAATYSVVPGHEPPFRTGDSINATSIMIEESVQVAVERSSAN